MKVLDLKSFCGEHYYAKSAGDSAYRFFTWLQDKRGQWLKVNDTDGEVGQSRVLFDGIVEDHDSLFCLVRFSENDVIGYKIHPSRFEQHEYFWKEEQAYAEYYAEDYDPDYAEYLLDIRDQHSLEEQQLEDACPHCGCTQPRIGGDEVYFGYCGLSVCPKCRR